MKTMFVLIVSAFLTVFTVGNTNAKDYEYIISVSQAGQDLGNIEIKLYPKLAPKHVHNFDSLVTIGFYDGTAFHRVVPGFMIQGGDPNTKDKPKNTWGMGDPSQTRVPAEFSKDSTHRRGIISAARAQDPNSATSQFFIVVKDSPFLDGKYTIFGEVVKGMDVVDKIVNVKVKMSPFGEKSSPEKKVEMKIRKK